jgi:hypothetical protein
MRWLNDRLKLRQHNAYTGAQYSFLAMNRIRRDERDRLARRLLHGGEAATWIAAKELAAERLKCGARTRKGLACQARKLPGRKRCRMHNGNACGPRSPAFRQHLRERMIQMNRTAEARERSRRMMAALHAKRWGEAKAAE